ncbi:RnfH family protein [Pleionea sediminis]|uniref:RnfH family protein n=1 Tax=Pleionea sediminis TaxID=2569479 RepID=UPI001186C16A|nr:RnfH family protein [Pleionea sediminis]
MKVEVVYALPEEQSLIALDVQEGTTVMEAIVLSQLLNKYPEIDLNTYKVGIFSKVTTLTAVLREFDRVEIYRPLKIDPKEIRRKKAEKNKKLTK